MIAMIIVAFFWSFWLLPILLMALVAIVPHIRDFNLSGAGLSWAGLFVAPIYVPPMLRDQEEAGCPQAQWPEWVKAEVRAAQREARPDLPPLAFITQAELEKKIAQARGEATAFYREGEFHVLVERRTPARPTTNIRLPEAILAARRVMLAKKKVGAALLQGPTGGI